MKYTSYYVSSMHIQVRYHVYEPKVILRVKGIVQIHHGLGEHADLYDHFAAYLLNQGFVVVVSDFAGHGQSLIDFEQGYFGATNGVDNLVKDIHYLQNIMRNKYPDVPYFMLGTDLGSLLIRKYATLYGDYIEGMILLGTPSKVEHRYVKRAYLNLMRKMRGPLYKAHHYFHSFHQHYSKKIHQSKSEIDWLTSDEMEKKKFLDDPMSHFSYTVQGYRDIIDVMQEVNSSDSIAKIPEYLSIYMGFGEWDPMCRHKEKLVEKYKNAKIRDLTVKVFPQMRHALLFEKEKRLVYQDILNWLNERTYL
ncbi:MAG: alpha/beta fold hydrolase [Longibaculum sp.]